MENLEICGNECDCSNRIRKAYAYALFVDDQWKHFLEYKCGVFFAASYTFALADYELLCYSLARMIEDQHANKSLLSEIPISLNNIDSYQND